MMATTTKKKKPQPKRADWSLAPRGTISATVQATLGLYAAASVGDLAHLSPVWGGMGAAAGALGTVMVAAHRQASPTAVTYRLACWTGGGGWLAWAPAASPWHPDTLAALGVGALVAGITAPL